MRWKNKESSVQRDLPDVYPRLWRFCLALTGDKPLADDLAQTVALRALDRANQFQDGTNLFAWLATIARTTWINQQRSGAVRRGTGLVLVEDAHLQANESDPETQVFARQVFDIMKTLPEAQRAAALLVFVEGFSYADTASALDIPIGTVISRIAAARKSVVQATGEEMKTTKRKRG